MSEKFVASNGIEVRRLESFGGIWWDKTTPEKEEVALREFFLHERDTELGRWRDTPRDRWVVYPCSDDHVRVHVLDEAAGVSWCYSRDEAIRDGDDGMDAAYIYFVAHPEPKPWHDAVDGEIWEVTPEFAAPEPRAVVTPGNGGPATFVDPRARLTGIPVTSPEIISARRVWPEGGVL